MSYKHVYECDICGKIETFIFNQFPLSYGYIMDLDGKWVCQECFSIEEKINIETSKKKEILEKELEENIKDYRNQLIEKYKKEKQN